MNFFLCALLGFQGRYTNKSGGSQREGSATFFRESRYSLVTYKVLTLSEIVAELLQSTDQQHIHAQLRPILTSSESLQDHAQQVMHHDPLRPWYMAELQIL